MFKATITEEMSHQTRIEWIIARDETHLEQIRIAARQACGKGSSQTIVTAPYRGKLAPGHGKTRYVKA